MVSYAEPVALLPGPVAVAPAVRDTYHRPPLYHRSPAFIDLHQQVRHHLGGRVGRRDVVLFNGDGTPANDAVARRSRPARTRAAASRWSTGSSVSASAGREPARRGSRMFLARNRGDVRA
jgi:hypothetical protein